MPGDGLALSQAFVSSSTARQEHPFAREGERGETLTGRGSTREWLCVQKLCKQCTVRSCKPRARRFAEEAILGERRMKLARQGGAPRLQIEATGQPQADCLARLYNLVR